ncbi:GntR family transcriptional regulator [Streptomyces sp. RS10V-4]|uniref:GntR family transcriptional regulator n=1 Tax=Streptomyces rhizoryzae TaxID=2932493 RepID=UPI002002BD7A|nr:GntR family transcriptional regulator [Streptomyces rhizoryzae]MCK7624339.1 GntR family transcriptional regulator [Streptomyces rhizoryzae]
MDRSAPPPYRRIADEIRARITAGDLAPGDRVPSTRRITKEWGVAMATATKALTALGQEGVVQVVPGVGTVVAETSTAVSSKQLDEASAQAGTGPRRVSGGAGERKERRAREADGGLSRARIVRAGIGIADAEGLRAVSMRRVAAGFGVSSMALYRYVAGKDELVLLMADAVFAEVRVPDPAPEGWRERMEAGARLQWALYRRHPWLAQYLSVSRPQPMPRAMALIEWTMARVEGMDPVTLLHLALTLVNHVRGTAASLEDDLEAEQRTGLDRRQWMAAMGPAYERIIRSGRYPMYAGLGGNGEDAVTLDTLFEFGLARVLDGVSVLVEGRTALVEGRTAPAVRPRPAAG